MEPLQITLPWPPTSNHYWRRNGSRYFISEAGIAYRNMTYFRTTLYRDYYTEFDRLKVVIEAYPPDRRKRDLDNLGKCLLDSLEYALIFPDDSQIDELHFIRMPHIQNKVKITIDTIELCT